VEAPESGAAKLRTWQDSQWQQAAGTSVERATDPESLITLKDSSKVSIYQCPETTMATISTFHAVRSLSHLQALCKHAAILEILIRRVIVKESKDKMPPVLVSNSTNFV